MKLDDAVRALREESVLLPDRKRALRERIVARPRPSKKIALWAFPIAAALVASSVFASVSARWHSAAPAANEEPAPQPAVTKETIAPAPLPPPPPTVAATSPPVVTVPKVPPVPAEDRSLRAYREAERIQRVDKDCARAVPAWDTYLAQAGSSPLAVDARFSRALCLVRLGRRDEARAALAPFASGDAGSYRQSEAQSLLDELNER